MKKNENNNENKNEDKNEKVCSLASVCSSKLLLNVGKNLKYVVWRDLFEQKFADKAGSEQLADESCGLNNHDVSTRTRAALTKMQTKSEERHI